MTKESETQFFSFHNIYICIKKKKTLNTFQSIIASYTI